MIELSGVTKRFGDTTAVNAVTLSIKPGQLCVLVGTSGCGKSTTLRMINRLIAHDEGEIRLDGQPVGEFEEALLRRRIGYVIQSTGLFPHWTVARNIGVVPRLLKWQRQRVRERVEELMQLLGLPVETFADKYPHQLSGGQAQRVGVARALAADPDILLMDEPFGALDPITRRTLQHEMLTLQARLRKTIVFVTHDMDEALALADQLVVMDAGRIVQQGLPSSCCVNRPALSWSRCWGPGSRPEGSGAAEGQGSHAAAGATAARQRAHRPGGAAQPGAVGHAVAPRRPADRGRP